MSVALRPDGLVVYGLGTFGQAIIDELLAAGSDIELILDRAKGGDVYRGIPVLTLEDASDGRLTGKSVFIGLHNHYVDLHQISAALKEAGAAKVLTPVNIPNLIPDREMPPAYWLDHKFDYVGHEEIFAEARELLADDLSRHLFDAILRYRRGGDPIDCPAASLDDEYTPKDLPRFAEPLRIVDCGAFTGVAIHKFLKAGYQVERFVAFEPDPENFASLASRNFPVDRGMCLPLGTWSVTQQLRFSTDGSMASRLSDSGGATVQCVAVDDVLHGEPINLVKLDVEGAEIETLMGMRKLIQSQRPSLLVSAYHAPDHLFKIAQLIASWQLGYDMHLRVHEQNTFGVVLYALPAD